MTPEEQKDRYETTVDGEGESFYLLSDLDALVTVQPTKTREWVVLTTTDAKGETTIVWFTRKEAGRLIQMLAEAM